MPTDPTLFTQTGVHATSYKGTRIPIQPGPPGETPGQKVDRLRKAASAAKLAQGTKWDRLVVKGRRVADFAHKLSIMSLIGFSVGFGIYTFLSLGDMMVYNRRKRAEFYAVMEHLRAEEYAKALDAEAKGQATDDQKLLINQEQARLELRRRDLERKEKGVLRRVKESVIGTETYEEEKGGKLGIGKRKEPGVAEAVTNALAARDLKLGLGVTSETLPSETLGEGQPANSSPHATRPPTEQATTDKGTSRGWKEWITGR